MRLRSLLGLSIVLCFAPAVMGDAELITENVTAEELARAFQKDAAAARKRFIPNPDDAKKGKIAGVTRLIPIHGIVKQVGRGGIQLQTGTKLVVMLRSKKTPGKPGEGRQAASGNGFVQSFDGKTIIVEVDSVEFKRVLENEKKP